MYVYKYVRCALVDLHVASLTNMYEANHFVTCIMQIVRNAFGEAVN